MAPRSSNARPYCGKEAYIFVSYAHRNEAEVYKIIERMQAEGYRVWYDRGVDPGTEWADNIAERVASCDYFIACITQEYLKSTNCLDELSFARDKEKKRLLVYLTSVTLPDGISMRSNRLQAIHKYAYAQEEEFYEKLFQARGIDNSLGSSASDPESTAVPHVPNGARKEDEKTSTSTADGPSGQKQDVEGQQPTAPRPAAVPFASGWSVAVHFAAALWAHRRLFFLVAAVCIVLFLAAAGLFQKSGTGSKKGLNTAKEEEPEVVLDQDDLGGMAFGMSQEEIREILTAGGAKENSTAYDAEGMQMIEFVPAGGFYGKEVESFVSAAAFHGREIKSLIAGFDADGLYQIYYTLDAKQDANGKELLKELSSKYGRPSVQNDFCYQWDMDGDVAFRYFPVSNMDEDTILISVPHETYFDMRDFVWGMSPDEAKEAEAGRESPLALTKSGLNSDGCPYQFYEGDWEVYGSSVDLATLNFVEDQLVEIKYILSGRSFDQVVADCTALYGQGGEIAGDGSAMGWNVRMFNPETDNSVPIAFSVVKSENGVRLTFRDIERYQAVLGN